MKNYSGRFNPSALSTVGIIFMVVGILSAAVVIFNAIRSNIIYLAFVGLFVILCSVAVKYFFDALEEIIISLRNIEAKKDED